MKKIFNYCKTHQDLLLDYGDNMSSEVPPQVQNQIAQLQQVQQQLQAMVSQKAQVEMILRDVEEALNELESLPDDSVVYKGVGEILVKTKKEMAKEELEEKKETFQVRLKSLDKQIERLQTRFKQLQEQIRNVLGPMGPQAQ